MSKLIIIRHGQASFHGENYDLLSETGVEQGFALGRWWLKMGLRLDQVFIGPRARHLQTYEAVKAVFADAGLPFPEPELLKGLDEHQGPEVVKQVMSDEIGGDHILPKGIEGTDAVRVYFQRFQEITRRWIKEEFDYLGHETWRTFRGRVNNALTQMTHTNNGCNIAAFTSGGPCAAAVGHTLGLKDEQILELSWQIRNASFCEFLFSSGRISQVSFNAIPHF